jgi:hypothetical protein
MPFQVPSWLTAGAAISSIPAWIGLYITVRKYRSERPILKFTLQAMNVEAEEDEPTRVFFDGVGVVPAICVTVTNIGKQPLTIFQVTCRYSGADKNQRSFENTNTDYINKKLGEADFCSASPRCEAITSASHGSGRRDWRLPASTASHRGLLRHREYGGRHPSAPRLWRRRGRQR